MVQTLAWRWTSEIIHGRYLPPFFNMGLSKMKKTFIAVMALLVLLSSLAVAQDKRAFTLDDLFSLKRLGAPALSPDGNKVAFTVTKVDLKNNRSLTNIWIMDADGKN